MSRALNDTVFVIGNGFDIDLGLSTSYKDFVNSEFWPFATRKYSVEDVEKYDMDECLHDTLFKNTSEHSWYDLEAMLGHYATLGFSYNAANGVSEDLSIKAKNDKITYEQLINALTEYLLSIQNNSLNTNSVAARVLKSIILSDQNVNIFSFNYTDLNIFAAKLGIHTDCKVDYIHGNLNEGIILGIESQMNFCPPYRYMCKEYNPNYKSSILTHCLHSSKEIVIFGHSLSPIDYHYFQHFFLEQSKVSSSFKEMKRITIFTHNQDSAEDILDQLRNMNERRLDLLFANNVFNIIRTDGTNENKVAEFMKHFPLKKGFKADLAIW